MAGEINQKWLYISIERGSKEVHNDEYRKSDLADLGISTSNVIELSSLLLNELEMALAQAKQYNKRHLEIKFIY